MSTCCRIQLCCDPPEAAASLAESLSLPVESATAVLEAFRLVPYSVAPSTAAAGSARAKAAEVRLRTLHRLVTVELRSILADMGHEAGETEAEE
jgi:hypothetical protein